MTILNISTNYFEQILQNLKLLSESKNLLNLLKNEMCCPENRRVRGPV